jgi:hypothetical protein
VDNPPQTQQRAPIKGVRPDPALPEVFTRADAVRRGMTRHQVTHRARAGAWHRLRQGAFCLEQTWHLASPERRAALLACAVITCRRGTAACALSHVSAAALHGLPVPLALAGTAWITVAPGLGVTTHFDGQLRQEVATLPPGDVGLHGGLPVTSLARTAADCLRHLPTADGVAVADAALRKGLTREQLAAVLGEQQTWPLAAAARAALELVDGRRETALESRSFVVIHESGLPHPLCQVEVVAPDGRFVGRVDFVWPKHGVVGEADGLVKYSSGDAGRVVEAEKDRQAGLEALGLVVVRWGTRHLVGDPPSIAARLGAALAASPRSRFRGSMYHVAPPQDR